MRGDGGPRLRWGDGGPRLRWGDGGPRFPGKASFLPLLGAALLLLACARGARHSPVASPDDDPFEAFRRGEFDRAERLLASRLAAEDSANLRYLRGRLLASRGRLAEAIEAIEGALRFSGVGGEDAARLHFELAQLHLEAGDFARASREALAGGVDARSEALGRFLGAFEGTPYRVVSPESGAVPLRIEPFAEAPVSLGPGVEARLVLDTAASMCVLARSLAMRAGVVLLAEGEEALDLFGGRVRTAYGKLPSLSIGSARVENVPVLVLDDDRLTFRAFGVFSVVRAEGVIGVGLLRRFRTNLDLSEEILRLEAPGGEVPPGAIEIRYVRGGLLVPAGANGLGGLAFLLDTGANVSSLTEAGADSLAGRARIVVSPGSGAAVGGSAGFLRRALGVRLEFGRWIVDPLDLPVVGSGLGGEVLRSGILGLDVLRTFRIVLEPDRWRLVLEKVASRS